MYLFFSPNLWFTFSFLFDECSDSSIYAIRFHHIYTKAFIHSLSWLLLTFISFFPFPSFLLWGEIYFMIGFLVTPFTTSINRNLIHVIVIAIVTKEEWELTHTRLTLWAHDVTKCFNFLYHRANHQDLQLYEDTLSQCNSSFNSKSSYHFYLKQSFWSRIYSLASYQ